MTDAFKLQVPFETAYRALVPEVASRYAELLGGSSADAASFAAAVTSAIDRLAAGVGPDAHLDLAFRSDGADVHVDVSCNGCRETVNVTISLARH